MQYPRLSPDGAAGIDITPIYYSDATGNDIIHECNGEHGNAVFLPQNNREHSMRDATIARLIVGKRHCRVLTVGNINSSAN